MTDQPKFQLTADFSPAGDQPQAIAKLVEGLRSGLSHQTLLGVTGSGKSIGYDDPIVVQEKGVHGGRTMVVRAGPFIDSLIESYGLNGKDGEDTEQYACADRRYFTQAFNAIRGSSGWHPVGAFLRHRAPGDMFRLTTKCGRSVTLTGDHNLWVLRDGAPILIRTEEVRTGDCLPAPDKVTATESLRTLDILPYLADSNLSVFAETDVLQFVAAGGRDEFISAIGACGIGAAKKLSALRNKPHGSGLRVRHFLRLASATNLLGGRYPSTATYVGGKNPACRLPARLSLTDSVLRLFGYYVAEGNGQRGYVIIANRNPVLRRQIEQALSDLGLSFGVRPSSDYQVSSSALARLLSELCGNTAAYKRLPEFWPRLSDRSLGIVLRAYFDGDGTVGSNGEVSATTASEALASDLAYALKRFGIHARLRRTFKRATNSDHAGAMYSCVVVSNRDDVQRFADSVGFDHPDKSARLSEILKRGADTNTDVIPIGRDSIRELRQVLSLSMLKLAALAGCSGPMISLIESGQRRPSRKLLGGLLEALCGEARRRGHCTFEWWKQWRALHRLCGMRWMPIRSLDRIQYDHPYVYDLSVPGPETFLAGTGGVFVHNTYSVASVIEQVQRPTLVLAHNKTLAAQLYGEFREFFPNNAVEYFVSYYDYYQPEAYVPSSDTYIEKDASINQHIEQMRLSATKGLLERSDVIIVATVSAIYGLGDPQAYLSMVLHLVRGEVMDQRKLLRRLADMQYTRNELDLEQATYRVRGDIIDIFPAEADREAIRVELDDEEIKSLTLFDPLTGETLRKLPRFTVYPATHYVTPKEKLLNVLDQIREELIARLKELRDADKLVEAQRLEQRTLFDIEMMKEVGYCSGIENYSRYLSGRAAGEPPPCLFDYLPDNALLIIDESHQTVPQLGAMYRGDRSRKETLVNYGFRLPSALDNRPLRFDEFERMSPQCIFVSATPGAYEAQHSGQVVEQVVRPTGLIDPVVEVRPVRSQVEDVLSEIRRCAAANQRVLITTLTKRMAEDLTEFLHEHGVRVRYLHSDVETVERVEIIRDLRLGKFDVLVGINLLREGLDMPEVALVAILDADKEGFLRSDNSLIQTIGRAARNIDGRAILYADKVTRSMQRAMDETDRRRTRQIEYNKEHGITPRGIVKNVMDIMEGARSNAAEKERKVAEEALEYGNVPPEQIIKRIKKLEQEMFRLARNLEFEEAAQLRDQIARMRKAGLGLGDQLAS